MPGSTTWKAQLVRALVRAPIGLYRVRLGFLLGHRLLLLQHTGRVSGQPRQAVLEVVARPGPSRYVVAAGFGDKAQWYRNVVARPAIQVSVGRGRLLPGQARPLARDQAAALLDDYCQRHPLAWRMLAPALGHLVGLRPVTVAGLTERIPLVELDLRGDPDAPPSPPGLRRLRP